VHAILNDPLTRNLVKNNELKIYLFQFIEILVERDSGLSAYQRRRIYGCSSEPVARGEIF
jgi:hypothetical protein